MPEPAHPPGRVPPSVTPLPEPAPKEPLRREPIVRAEEHVPHLEEGERVYKEGRSIVVETTVAEDGLLVRYRKVLHPWGEEHYFREGIPIPDRTYRAALGK